MKKNPTVYPVFRYWLSNDKVELMKIYASERSARAYCQEQTKDDRSIAGIACWRYKDNPDAHLHISPGPLEP